MVLTSLNGESDALHHARGLEVGEAGDSTSTGQVNLRSLASKVTICRDRH